MKNVYEKVACAGADVHYKISQVTMRDASGRVVRRERLEHEDWRQLRDRLSRWPRGIPMVMEASFGWGWLSDEMVAAGLQHRRAGIARRKVTHGIPGTARQTVDSMERPAPRSRFL